jgi:ribonuclease VapC
MIIDSSAIIAILHDEPDAQVYAGRIEQASPNLAISAANYLETAIVIDARRDAVASRKLDAFMTRAAISIEPVTAQQASIARQAYRDFGKGSGHRAQLNFGDCFAYALAVDTGRALLFKGDDFGHTDVTPAA